MGNDTWRQPALIVLLQDRPKKKYCTKCLVTKPVAQFSPRGKGRTDYQSWCKICMSDYSTERARVAVRRKLGLPLDTPKMQGYRKPAHPEGAVYGRYGGGYLYQKATGHHRADRYGWVQQHILVAEEKFGIRVTRHFTVHHINGDRQDNRPENLDLRWGNHGKGADVIPALLRLPEMRAVARAVLAQYDDEEVSDGEQAKTASQAKTQTEAATVLI